MNIIIYLFWFVLYVTLHYVEGLPPIGGLSIAQLWKMPLIGYLLLNAIHFHRRTFKFEKCGYTYSLMPFLSVEAATSPFNIVLFSIKQLPTILFFRFWQRFNIDVLTKILIMLAQFVCLASLLTLTNIIEPIKNYQNAESIIEGMSYYSSIFGDAHAASSYFSIASVTLIYFLIKNRFRSKINKIFNIFLICVGLYSLFLSFTRTGWVMLLISLLFIIDFKKISIKNKIKALFICVITAIGIITLYNNNEAFRYRVSGSGQYKGESENVIDTEGSGRNDFWKNGIELWANSNLYCFLFGNGTDAVVANNKAKTGMPVGSHSLFIDTLAKYGIVTFIALLLFYYYQYRFIITFGRGSPYQPLCRGLLLGSIVFALFQGEAYFDFSVIYSITLVIMYKTNHKMLSQYEK